MYGFYVQIFVLSATACIATALEPLKDLKEEEVKTMVANHFKNIPDIDSKYMVNERLSKIIAGLYKGKVDAFPLFKVDLKIEREPVKIPWTVDQATTEDVSQYESRYKYEKIQKSEAQ